MDHPRQKFKALADEDNQIETVTRKDIISEPPVFVCGMKNPVSLQTY